MPLSIAGKIYTQENSREELLKAVKALPAPLPIVQQDFDSKRYQVVPQGNDFTITTQDGIPLPSTSMSNNFTNIILHGKEGTLFNTRSYNKGATAYGVPQGNVIFSTNKKIGTTNVQDCVALIIQESVSKKTALAHISQSSTKYFINNIVNYLPKGEKQVILVGARYGIGKNISSENVYKILTALLEHHDPVVINQSYVLDTACLVSTGNDWFLKACYDFNTSFGDIIFNPQTWTVTTGFPKCTPPLQKNSLNHDLDKELKDSDIINDTDYLTVMEDLSRETIAVVPLVPGSIFALKELWKEFNETRMPGEYEVKLIAHENKSDDQIKREYKNVYPDNNICAHGTCGFALFLAVAITQGKLLPKNGRKRAGLFTITGEILTDNKKYKKQMGPSIEDLLDENFVSAVYLNPPYPGGLYLTKKYANYASTKFHSSVEVFISRLCKKINKYTIDNNRKDYLINKVNKINIEESYNRLSKIPIIILGKGIGRGLVDLKKLGASSKEIIYEKIDIHYVLVAEKDSEFLRQLITEISDEKSKKIHFIILEVIDNHAKKNRCSFEESVMTACQAIEVSKKENENDKAVDAIAVKKISIHKALACKGNGNKILQKTLPVEYYVKDVAYLSQEINSCAGESQYVLTNSFNSLPADSMTSSNNDSICQISTGSNG